MTQSESDASVEVTINLINDPNIEHTPITEWETSTMLKASHECPTNT